MNITLVTVGTRGDVQPMVALGQTLQQRGHTITLAAPPDCREWVTGQGINFAPVGSDMKQWLHSNPAALSGKPAAAIAAAREFFARQLPLQAQDIEAACQGADAMVWAGLSLAAPVVAHRLKLPLLGVCFSTGVLPSPSGQHAPPSARRHGLPRWINRVQWAMHSFVSNRIAGKPLNALRAQAGLPPVKLRDVLMQGQFFLAVDPELFPRDPAWGPNIRSGQFIFHDDPRPLDPELEAWLNEGEPPVYVGFGSMSGPGTAHIGSIVHEALAATGRRCLISAGWAGLGTQGLPAHWRVVGDVAHPALFPRMAAVVHHGGSGTTANALRAGVPQVLLPLIMDQYHHAHRLWKAGLTPQPVPMEKITAPQLASAIQAAMALPAGPRQHMARRLRESDGNAQVAAALEALAAAAPAN